MPVQSSSKRVKRYKKRKNCSKIKIPTVNIPDDLLEEIISLLPIQQAASLSLLSTRFKNSWRNAQDLCFDRDFSRRRGKQDLVDIINRLFKFHSADKIKKFSLYINPIGIQSSIRVWIKEVVSKGVEEIDLDFSDGGRHLMLPFSLLDVESVRVLNLTSCRVDLPPKFSSLCLLRTLVLKKVGWSMRDFIKSVFSNCLLIEKLELIKCSWVRNVEINAGKEFRVLKIENCSQIYSISIRAPSLCTLHYHGDPSNIKFDGKMVRLNDVILNFTPPRNFKHVTDMKDFMANLSFVNVLTVSSTFMEGLSQRFVHGQLKELPFYFWNLKEFHLCIGITYINLYDIASFLKNCPYLESLFIDVGEFSLGKSHYWECHGKEKFKQCEPSFRRLKLIKMNRLKFQTLEIEMVKFFLQKARFLETLVLVLPKNSQKDLLVDACRLNHCFLPASPNARIEIYEYTDDRSCIHPTHMKVWA